MALAHSPRLVTDGLVLCLDAGNVKSYPGSGTTWSDLSGNGNNGTFQNMDGNNLNSDNGGSLTFDGTNEYVSCGDPDTLNFGTGNFTLSFVTYRTGTGFQGGGYVGKGNGTSIGFDFRDSVFFVHGTSGLIASMSFASGTNVWEHHTFVFDRTSSPYIKRYLNGTYNSASTTNNSANVSSSIDTTIAFRIGLSTAGGPSRYYIGRMSSVIAYNRALTASEVSQNYNAIRGRYGI